MTNTTLRPEIEAFYAQFPPEQANKLKVNYDITHTCAQYICNNSIRDLAHELTLAVRHRVWEAVVRYPGTTRAKVASYTLNEWVTEELHSNLDDLMRLVCSYVGDQELAANTALALIEALAAEDKMHLYRLRAYGPENGQGGPWSELLKEKARSDKHWQHTFLRLGRASALDQMERRSPDRLPDSDRERGRAKSPGASGSPIEKVAYLLLALIEDPVLREEKGVRLEACKRAYQMWLDNRKTSAQRLLETAGLPIPPSTKALMLRGTDQPPAVAARLRQIFPPEWIAALIEELQKT